MEAPAVVTINVERLKVRYTEVLALNCERATLSGSVIAVVGHNGAGKSTFIKCVLKLLAPSTGRVDAVYSQGDSHIDLVPEQHMAFCPEMGSVFADISVESYIKLWCRFKHRDGNYFKKKGSKYLELLDLPPLLHKLGRELSKGQRRRVQTAIGFLSAPKLFLFDEPFDGLDVLKTHELTTIIEGHRQEMTFIVSSHRMDVVERLADFVLVLKNGDFVSHGPVEKVAAELAGITITVHLKQELLPRAREILHGELPNATLNVIGTQLSVTGKDVSLEAVEHHLTQNGISEHRTEAVCPSLVDAMNYHLRRG
jgi:ABC-2 type transport system ATP-binding protein